MKMSFLIAHGPRTKNIIDGVPALIAVMRRNVRWGGRYMSGDDQLEHTLIQSLKALRRQIFSLQHSWHAVNPAVYLQPFLDVIRSDETGAPITGVALSSLYKILTLDVLDLNTVNVEDAMHLVVDAVTKVFGFAGIRDPELPVRVDSVFTLRSFVESSKGEIRPILPQLLDDKFGEGIAPYALGLCQSLAAAFWKYINTSEVDEEADDPGDTLETYEKKVVILSFPPHQSDVPTSA
ncbi:hypothetical protein M8C21_031155 [Ambrosia artemisiifolia]|uniref:Uncharacterized protein n=1 Tax=Ambrosia artemisiifolia TaxID=4212 RepID=A0AAD5CGZ2_AMBAR|nr:hypothetical protein M8C21_031155 [Ambrosia artemisiifolia]